MSILERLQKAIAGHYDVESVIGGGSASIVFGAHDIALDRLVAIKVLKPELATARGAERFIQEARTVANLQHPGVIAVHEVGEVDGLFYFVMDRMPGASLQETLAGGRLTPRTGLRLADGLLAALEAVHAHGLVHRDVKPANVFLVEDAPVLADFGTAARAGARDSDDSAGWAGTPGYMAPELLAGEEATAGSDVYAVAAILFECLTGRRWNALHGAADADWTGVPDAARSQLAKALAREPDDRYPGASELRAALDGTSTAPGRFRAGGGRLVALAAAAVAIAAAVYGLNSRQGEISADAALLLPPPTRTSELAVLPCLAVRDDDRERARGVSRAIHRRLGGFPTLHLAPVQQVFRWADAVTDTGTLNVHNAPAGTRSRRVVWCEMERVALDSVRVRALVVEGGARPEEVYSTSHVGQIDRDASIADSIVLALLAFLLPDLRAPLPPLPLSVNLEANQYLARGYDAFLRHALSDAAYSFEEALKRDPEFAAARWGLADVLRWAALSHPGEENLRQLFEERAGDLGWRDSLLVMATIEPHGPDAFRMYESAIGRLPNDGYALLLYGDELFHRGALWGVDLDSAESVLRRAAETDPLLAPAWDHLAQVQIRLGEEGRARATLERLRATSAEAARGDIDFPAVWSQAFLERFDAEHAAETRPGMFMAPDGSLNLAFLTFGSRLIRYVDLPGTQLAMALALIDGAPAGSTERLGGFNAAGLAYTALGRQQAGLTAFDSAAVVGARGAQVGPDARLHAAEWRVVPAALSIPGYRAEEIVAGRAYLESVATDDLARTDLRARAAWALAVDAFEQRDLESAERWQGLLDSLEPVGGERPATGRLLTHLRGERLARDGRFREAVSATDGLTVIDSAGTLLRPFARAAVYVRRGQWSLAAGDTTAAVRAWLWHQNTDLEGVPAKRIQAGEVDGALGTHARLWIARTAQRSGDRERACRNATDIARLWRDPDPDLAPLADEAARIAAAACSR